MNRNTKKIALSGLLLAITMIILFLAEVSPVNELSLYALSSFIVSIIVVESGACWGWMFYISSCLLCLLLPDKLAAVPYVLFFGNYGIVKYYIEKMNKIALEYILKLAYFNIFIYSAMFLIKDNLIKTYANFPFWAVIAGFELVFIIYDYVYTLFVVHYKSKLRKILKI